MTSIFGLHDFFADLPTCDRRHLAEVLRNDQRARWQRGERVLVEAYLAQNSDHSQDTHLVLTLVASEISLRMKVGETPRLEDYVERLPTHARTLEKHFSSLQPWTCPAPTLGVTGAAYPEQAGVLRCWPEVPGYELIAELGQGGMGVVYLARQMGLNRVVALKMMHQSVHGDCELLARFRREAEAVARLQHVNIVQVYATGEAAGRPFFALEYVEGGNLAAKLAGQPQPPREAAGLVELLAGAMHYAHTHGIIHRDLKPSNVLLSVPWDGTDGEKQQSTASPAQRQASIPKISDFGLARPLDTSSAITRSGHAIGTPSYMSPEQAMGRSEHFGPTVDVYGLGALLYEALTGRPPFRAPTEYDTILQVVNEQPVAPRQLQPMVPVDLETICLKCLEKQPERRYATAQALEADLRRFLNGEPIVARSVSTVERGWRWMRRNPLVGGLAAGLVLILTLSLIGLTVLYVNAVEQRERAERESHLAELARLAAEQERDRANDAQREAEDQAREAQSQERRAERQFMLARGVIQELLDEAEWNQILRSPELKSVREALLNKALRFHEQLAEDQSSDPLIRRQSAAAYYRIAEISRKLERFQKSESAYQKAIEAYRKLAVDYPNMAEYRHRLAGCLNNLGLLYKDFARPGDATRCFQEAAELEEKLVVEMPGDPEKRHFLALHYLNLGYQHEYKAAHQEAEAYYSRARTLLTELIGGTSDPNEIRAYERDLASTLSGLATAISATRPKDALGLIEQSLQLRERQVQEHPGNLDAKVYLGGDLCNRGLLASDLGRHDEALSWYARAQKQLEEALEREPQDHVARRYLRNVCSNQGRSYQQLNQLHSAVVAYDRAFKLDSGPTRERYRLLSAGLNLDLGRHSVVLEEARATLKKPMTGRTCEDWARTCCRGIRVLQGGGDAPPQVVPPDPAGLQEEYALAAISLLTKAAAGKHFNVQDNLDRLLKDESYDVLRQRAEFKKLITEATTR